MKNANINALRASIAQAFDSANSLYIARNARPVLNANGMQSDIAEGKQNMLDMTEGEIIALEKMGVNLADVALAIATSSNVKKAKRAPQFLRFIVSGNGAFLKGSAQTALLGFCALMIGAKNRNGLNFTVTGKGDDNTSDSVSLQRARAVQKNFGVIGQSSAPTQLSVAFSMGGILPMIGLCGAMNKGDALPAINNNAIARELIARITSATDSTVALWAEQSKARKGSK